MLSHVLVGRKAKTAGKSALKKFKTAVGIPTGPISEANPRYYLVLPPQGALVRREIDLNSPQVYNLRQGDVVTCAEITGRRARIIDPVEGWVSLVSTHNEIIMELTFPPDKKTQVSTMNRRFDKLQEQQATKGSDSPIATPMVHRTDSAEPACEPSNSEVKNLKSKIVFKSHIPIPVSVPALALKSTAPKVDLLDLESTSISTPEKVFSRESSPAPSTHSLI